MTLRFVPSICVCFYFFFFCFVFAVGISFSFFFPQGYSPKMLAELNETTIGSAERQLYTLMYRLLQQVTFEKNDVKVRIEAIMEGETIVYRWIAVISINSIMKSLYHFFWCFSFFVFSLELINPYSVTAKALRYLRPLSFEF